LLVADAAALPCPSLDQHVVAQARQLLDADGDQSDAGLVRLDFVGNPDDIVRALRHRLASPCSRMVVALCWTYSGEVSAGNQDGTAALLSFAWFCAPSVAQSWLAY